VAVSAVAVAVAVAAAASEFYRARCHFRIAFVFAYNRA